MNRFIQIACCAIIFLISNSISLYGVKTVQADVSDFREIYSMDIGVRIESIDWNPNGTQFAVGLFNGFINIYNSSSYRLELVINATWYPTQVIPKWNPNGSLIAGGGKDNRIHIFDAITGEQLKYFEIYEGYAFSIAWSPDGKHLANGNRNNNLTQIWDIETGEKVIEFNTDDKSVQSVSWSHDGTRLVTSSRSVDVWYTSNWTKMTSIKNATHPRSAFSPNGNLLAIYDVGYNISIYNTSDWSLYRKIIDDFDILSISWSPDSRKIVCGYDSHDIGIHGTHAKIWDVVNITPIITFHGEEESFNEVAWSPDGNFILSTPDEVKPDRGIFRIWGEISSAIKLVSFSCDRSELEIGQTLRCTAIVRNYSTVNGTNLALRFFIDDDSLTERLFNITKGKTVEHPLEINISNDIKPGRHVLKAKFNNDEKKFQVVVLDKPDIDKPNVYIKDIRVDRNEVTVGQTVSITTTLGNNGMADSPYTLCTLFLELKELNSTHLMIKQNSTESYQYKLNTKTLKPGDYTIRAVTGNQSKEVTITIKPKVVTEVTPNVFCVSIILMIIVMTIITVIYLRKQN